MTDAERDYRDTMDRSWVYERLESERRLVQEAFGCDLGPHYERGYLRWVFRCVNLTRTHESLPPLEWPP